MGRTIELSEDWMERIEGLTEDDESVDEFIEELVTIYEQDGRLIHEGP